MFSFRYAPDFPGYREQESIFSESESKFCFFSQRKKVQLCYKQQPLRLQTGAPGRPSYFIPPELLMVLQRGSRILGGISGHWDTTYNAGELEKA